MAACFLLTVILTFLPLVKGDNQRSYLHPVVFVPGIAQNQLESKFVDMQTGIAGCPPNKDWFLSYIDEDWAYDHQDCFVESLTMEYDYQDRKLYNRQGAEVRVRDFGSVESMTILDTDHKAKPYDTLVESLTSIDYEDGRNLFGAPYDFRLGPNQLDDFFEKLSTLIQDVVDTNNNYPVVLVAHGMGAPLLNIFLNTKPSLWRHFYVNSMVSLSGTWGGSVSSIKDLAQSVYNTSDGTLKSAKKIRTDGSLMYMMPNHHLWNNEPIVSINETSYGMEDLEFLLRHMNLDDNFEMYKDVKPFIYDPSVAPNVPLHCLYGYDMGTLKEIQYESLDLYPNYPKSSLMGDGDGSVNLRSLDMCSEFKKYQKEPVVVKKYQYYTHFDTVLLKEPLKYLTDLLTSIAKKTRDDDVRNTVKTRNSTTATRKELVRRITRLLKKKNRKL